MPMKQVMNFLFKTSLILLCILSTSYYCYFYITPSVTVINNSQYRLTEVNVKLRNSNLNFGSIEPEQINSIHYSLKQMDGSYDYSFKIGDSRVRGTCGYITSSEFNKRFEIIVSTSDVVTCVQ